ncbi:MAG: hypothetical protein WBN65_13590 [Gammaproteobacteria bacterium]
MKYSALHNTINAGAVTLRAWAASALIFQPALVLADPPAAAPADALRAATPSVGTPIDAYPDRYALPEKASSPIALGTTRAELLSETSTMMAAYAFNRPSSPEEFLVYLRELEEVPFLTLWEGNSTRVFFGLDEDRHPGLHFSPRRD